MLMAGLLTLLNAMGASPTPQKLEAYKLDYRERMHHVHMDFASTRIDGRNKNITIGLGYEYHIDRQFNGVSVEVLGQKIGKLLFQGDQGWWVGGGIGWWPIRHVKVFMQAGALFDGNGTAVQGRVGVGYNLSFFMLAVMPYLYVQTTDDGQFSWSLGARVQY
jgi:hypothetical protein